LGAVAAAGITIALFGEDRTNRPQQPAPKVAETTPTPASPTPSVSVSHHWSLQPEGAGASAVHALVLRGAQPQPTSLLVSLGSIPLSGDFFDRDGAPIEARVFTHNIEQGFALLTAGRAAPTAIEALQVSGVSTLAPGDEVAVHTVEGESGAGLVTSTDDGKLMIDRPVTPGSVIVADGKAVAWAARPGELMPLTPLGPWLGQPGTRSLKIVQRELAEWSPDHLRAQVAEIFSVPRPSDRDLTRALTLLERLASRAAGADEFEALAQGQRDTYLRLVRLLARDDPVRALEHARTALARFPDHVPLLADAVVLCLNTGDPVQAIPLYQQLAALSLDDANRLRGDLAASLRRHGLEHLGEGRTPESLSALSEAVRLFPDRGELHAAHAQALKASGLDDAALAAAEAAARLDPAHARSVERYRRPAATQQESSGVVSIPIDPSTNSILTEIRVGGEPVELVVDTGASVTTLPSALIKRLGLWHPDLPTTKVTTASGTTEAEVVRIPELSIGSIVVRRVRVLSMDLPGKLAGKGLLGLNVLRRLNMRLDSENSRLLLEKRGSRRR